MTVKKSGGADLADLNVTELPAAAMTVYHPVTEQPMRDESGDPWTITLESAYSKTYENALHQAQNRRLQRRKRRVTAEDIKAGGLECLVAVTRGWSGITLNGEKLPFDEKNAWMLYERYPFIREQAEQFIEDQANFLPTSNSS